MTAETKAREGTDPTPSDPTASYSVEAADVDDASKFVDTLTDEWFDGADVVEDTKAICAAYRRHLLSNPAVVLEAALVKKAVDEAYQRGFLEAADTCVAALQHATDWARQEFLAGRVVAVRSAGDGSTGGG